MDETVGFFRPGGSWLHRLNPLPKALFVLWGIVAPFVLPAEALPFLIAAGLLVGLSARLGVPYVRAVLLGSLPLLVSIVVVNAFFFPGATDVLLRVGPLAATREGLEFGVPIAGRVIAALTLTIAFLFTTRPDDLLETLVQRGASPKLAFVVLGAIQTMPRMGARAQRILEAQAARGLRTTGSVRARAGALLPLLGPLLVGAIVDVRDRSLALEARAFGTGGPRTAFREVPYRPIDRAVAAAGVVALVGLAATAAVRAAGVLP